MAFKLSSELVDASKGSGDAIRKKEENLSFITSPNSGRTEEHKSVPISDPLGSEKEIENQDGKTNVTGSSRMDEEQRFSEEKDPEDIGIAHLSNEEIEILMENGFKESIYLLRTQHQAAMAALRSIKMEKSQSMKSDSKESHRPLDGGNQVPRKQRELSDEHQSFPIGPISDRYREAIEKAKISQKLDLNSEESFPELKDHQPLDGGPGKDDGGVAKEKGVKFAGETTYYFERGQTSGTKQDHGSEAAAGKEAAGKMAKDLPEKQNLEGDESSGDEGKATAVIGGAYGGLSMRPGIKDRPVWKPTGVKSMLRDCWSWCWRKRTRKMILESSDWQRVDVGDLSRFSEEVQVVVNQCTERVNCVADCFVNASANVNIAYIKKDALPRGIGRVLALEGVPHFVFVPGLDFA
nr:ribosomal protein S7 [Ipomoea batatas]